MTQDEIRKLALDILGGIAPEADLTALAEDDELREVLDIDSMDLLNFIVALHEATAVAIPETNYKKLSTLGGIVGYLAET